jgi:ATP-dependent Clp endopeptidase proteolytic subunit ClpP
MGHFAFALAGDGSDTLELDIYSVIGESFWFDSVSAKNVRRRLKESAKAKLIKLRIHSDGGDIFDAQAIYSDLQAHPARVEAEITGLAASAATLVAMAADHISIAEGAWFMIHNPWGGTMGEAEDLEAWAQVLRKATGTFADVYAARSGQSKDKVLELMAAETWMTAKEAKALGFVDQVVPARAKSGSAKAQRGALRSVGFAVASGDYTNVPAELRSRLGDDPQTELPLPSPRAARAQDPSPPGRTPEPPSPQQEPTMAFNVIRLLAVLGLPETADEAAAESRVNAFKQRDRLAVSFEELTGQQGDAALGTARAWKESAAKVPSLEAALAETTAKEAKSSLEQLIAKGRSDKKLTKAEADKLQKRVEDYNKAIAEKRTPNHAEEWSFSMAQAYVDALPVQPHLAGEGNPGAATASIGPNAPKPTPSASGALTHDGKTYEQLSGNEAAALEQDDPDTYKALRADWVKRGEPEFKKPAA